MEIWKSIQLPRLTADLRETMVSVSGILLAWQLKWDSFQTMYSMSNYKYK